MARKTAIDKLNKAISDILDKYADSVQENVGTIAIEMGKRGAKALRQKSQETFPVNKAHKITGKYAKGWTYTSEQKRMSTTVTIYNEHPALPHLLEYGHATRNGDNRVYPRTPAHEHIKPVADELIETFEREVLSKL